MNQFTEILPGIRLRCAQTDRFKSSCLSISLLRPLCREEAAKNALLSNVLMQGTENHPDMTSLSMALDELYGTSLGPLCRKIGDIQTVGFYMSCLDDRYAMEGDSILAPALELLGEVLLQPCLEDGAFREDVVALEKENLINTIEAAINDKRAYADRNMLKALCREDTYGTPRLGEAEDVAAITAQNLYAHYKMILETSRVEIFYGGSMSPETVAELLKKVLGKLPRGKLCRTRFFAIPRHEGVQHLEETMEVTQGKLSMGFTTGITAQNKLFPAMVVFNTLFGGDMTSKLFVNVREKQSLCYYISTAMISTKGIMTLSCGIETRDYEKTVGEIMRQLSLCQQGQITEAELSAAKKAIASGLRSVEDSLASMEELTAFHVLGGIPMDRAAYLQAILEVTAEDAAEVARSIQLDTVFFLRGVQA